MKVNNNWFMYKTCLAPFDDVSSGGGSGIEFLDDDDGDETIDGKDLEESDDEDDNEEDDEDDKSSAPPFDAQSFAKAIADGLRPTLQQQPAKLSREDIEKQLGKPNPSVELIKMIRDPETAPEKALEALSSLMNSQNEYLLKASGLAIDGRVQELNPSIQALQQYHLQQQEKEFTNGIVRKYPALKGKGPAVVQAMQILRQQNYKPASQSAARRDVAMLASRLIKQFDTNFSLKPKQQQSSNFMRPGSGSGRGNSSKKASVIDAVFPVR